MRSDHSTLKSLSYCIVLDQMDCWSYQKHISRVLRDKLLYLPSGLPELLCLYGLFMWTKKTKSHDRVQPSFVTDLAVLQHLTSSEGWRGQTGNCHHSEDDNTLLQRGKLVAGELEQKRSHLWSPGASTQVNYPSFTFWGTCCCVLCASQQ